MSFDVVTHVLTADLATSATFTFGYPTDRSKGDYDGSFRHVALTQQSVFNAPAGFTLSFGATLITFTYLGTTTLLTGATVRIQLDRLGRNDLTDRLFDLTGIKRTDFAPVLRVSLGSPDVLDLDGISVAQTLGSATNLTITGALASGGSVTLDVPRGLQIDSANGGDTTQTITVTGTDEYGVAMTEDIDLNGTTAVFGVKAFKTVTQVAIDAASAGNITVGTSDLLGLPVRVASANQVVKEFQDDVDPVAALTDNSGGTAADTLAVGVDMDTLTDSTTGTANTTLVPVTAVNGSGATTAQEGVIDDNFADIAAQLIKQQTLNALLLDHIASLATKVNALLGAEGTIVTAVDTDPSATTGDVRGTYDPLDAADGSRGFTLLVAVPDPKETGLVQA